MTAATIIEKLNLIPHPEGGYYRETYRSEQSLTLDNGNKRNVGTAIYYLLNDKDKSHFHKINSDELWLFHQGTALEILLISDEGSLIIKTLGNRLDLGEKPQILIKAHTWFAARVKHESGFGLVSCIVTPGFDFADFTLGKKAELIRLFPALHAEIEQFCL
jgi:predicted cupin superfamily sugar epimerase